MAIQFTGGPVLSNKQVSIVLDKIARKEPMVVPTVKRAIGRPSSGKETVTLRVDKVTVDRYRASGEGWRERMAADLAKAAPTSP